MTFTGLHDKMTLNMTYFQILLTLKHKGQEKNMTR